MFKQLFIDQLIVEHLWVFFLLPLPLLVIWSSWSYPSRRSALKVSFFNSLRIASGMKARDHQAVTRATWSQKLLALFVWILVITSLSRPQLVGEPMLVEHPQRDLLLSIDLSGSMETRDFTLSDGQSVDRLQAVKSLLNTFLDQRSGERIGMIFFGSAAFVQAPFTTDLKALKVLLNEAQVAMAGPKTVIGDSIALTVKMFTESKVEDRLLILLTDGNDTTSKVPPDEAAKLAKENAIKIIAIAVGDPENAGENPIDRKTLEAVAATTGGQFYYALDSSALKNVLAEINRLTPKKVENQSYSPTTDLYFWPLLAALLLILLYGAFIMVKHYGKRT